MAHTEIEALLQKVLGLKVTSIGQATLERAIKRRMQVLSLSDKDVYLQRAQSSVLELNELIEEVVIPETWFFRDQEPFNLITKFLKEKRSENPEAFLRLLSVPCSTGEEPYSLAIALLKAGWPANNFQVIGVDISSRSLARAQKGEYGNNSFRGENIDFRDPYFEKEGSRYILQKSIRNRVHFKHGNLLNPAFLSSLGIFDIIFCKNVLIYLDDESRKKAIKSLYQQLSDDGLLFVGHAEAGLFLGTQFSSLPYPQAFAFKKTKKKKPPAFIFSTTLPAEKKVPARNKNSAPDKGLLESTPPYNGLETARKLADEGRLSAAITACERILQEHGPSAQAYFLLGVIHDAAGNSDKADKHLRKAVYLDPDYLDALIHLALLTERSGEIKRARSIKERIKRIEREKCHNDVNRLG